MNKITRLIVAVLIVLSTSKVSLAFNLWTDIEQQTQWTIGSSVAAGTAMALRDDSSTQLKAGQFIGSALAQVANYRFLSLWVGGNFIPTNNGTSTKPLETAKIGLNAAYLLKGFTNQPPAVIRNLVFGPSLTTTIWTTPHVVIPFLDLNYAFGGTPPGTAASTPLPATVMPPTATSRLNLVPLAMDEITAQKG